MKVTFEKVDVNNAEVIALSKVCGETKEKCAAFINNQKYRKAYNRMKVEEMKVMKEFYKANQK